MVFSILGNLTTVFLEQGPEDLENDSSIGFQVISADDIDDFGIPAIIKHIRERIGDNPVYLRCVYSLKGLMVGERNKLILSTAWI